MDLHILCSLIEGGPCTFWAKRYVGPFIYTNNISNMFTVSKDMNCLRIGLKFDVLLSFRFNFFPTHVHGPRFNATWLYRVDFPVKIFKHITMFLRGIIFIQKKLTKKSYPKISHIKNFIQKFYPKMFLSKIYVTYSMSLYNNN